MLYLGLVETRRVKYYILAVLALGAGGIISQTVLLRELLVLFSGNEFSIGVIIGFWVLCEAAGSFAAGRWSSRLRDKPSAFIYLTLLFSALFPLTLFVVRVFRNVIGIPIEVGVGLWTVIYSSFLILLPMSFLHGFLFVLACALQKKVSGDAPAPAGKVYFYETAGTIAGGVAVSYILIPHFSSFGTAFLTSAIGGAACLFLGYAFGVSVRKTAVATSAGFLVIAALLPASGTAAKLENLSIGRQWRGRDVVSYKNSFYENISVIRSEGQYTFYTDGTPLITTPVPDIGFVEEMVHFPMLAHPRPVNVLILSGGAGGIINEVLKYTTVRRVDYVEIDPEILRTIRRFQTPLTKAELDDPRVHLHYVDGRIFIKNPPVKYDVVLLGLAPPRTVQENRYFTSEFFKLAGRAMENGGVMALAAPGSLTYYCNQLRDLNACLMATLTGSFGHIFTVPGDTNIYLASASPGVTAITPGRLSDKLESSGIKTKLMNRPHISYRLDPMIRAWFDDSVGKAAAPVNTDCLPAGLLYNIMYQNLQFSPWVNKIFSRTKGMRTSGIAVVAAAFFIAQTPLARRRRDIIVPSVMAATGFAAMMLELLLIMGFQIFYGHVFAEVGLLMAAFMGGIAAGSRAGSRPGAADGGYKAFMLVDLAIALFCLALPFLFMGLGPAFAAPTEIYFLFIGLLFVSGALTGMQFPLANRIYGAGTATESAAGAVFGADLVGGWAGGVIGGFFILPVIGLIDSLFLLAVIKACSFSLTAFSFMGVKKEGTC